MKITSTTITLCLLSLGAFAQLEVPVPYNPDGNADGFITLPDLLDFLALYGGEYSPEALATDSSSAIIHMGQGDYFDCASWCAGLEGNWKVIDEILVGRYKDQIQTMTSNNSAWMDRRSNNGMSYQNVPILQPDDWSVFQSGFNADRECICQTRVIQPIVIQSGPCQGNVDLCGICDGPGPVYECGCFEIPEGGCDCEGNQLDALGECGGNCLGDFDGDGICDSFAGGPCANEESITYDGFDYALVEIGEQCWFKENFRATCFANGDTINTVNSFQSATNNNLPHWTVYEPYQYNGLLYNWRAVSDERGLCPTGWRAPSVNDWNELVAQIGAPNSESLGNALADNEQWNGNNSSGFSATVTIYSNENGSFYSSNPWCFIWTSSYGQFPYAQSIKIITGQGGTGIQTNANIAEGRSVRCMKDAD